MSLADKLRARFTGYRMAVPESPAERVARQAREQEAERIARRNRRPEVLCEAVLADGVEPIPYDFEPNGPGAA